MIYDICITTLLRCEALRHGIASVDARARRSHRLVGAVPGVFVLLPWPTTQDEGLLLHLDIVEHNALHRVSAVPENGSGGHLRILDENVAKSDVPEVGAALCGALSVADGVGQGTSQT